MSSTMRSICCDEVYAVRTHSCWSGGRLRVHQQVEHRHDAVERRADLVAHGGEELALGHHRRFGRLLGLTQLLFELRGGAASSRCSFV